MTPRLAFVGVWIVLGATCAAADSIVIGGVMYDNVVVREGPSQYYVQLPADGRTLSVAKSSVNPTDLVIGKDKAERQALLDEWAQKNALRPKPKEADKKAKRTLKPPPASPSSPVAPQLPAAPESGVPPAGSVSAVKSAAGGSMVETGTFSDEKGVKRLVLKGNREKDVGIERRIETQRAMERAAQRAAEEQAEQEMIAQEMAAEEMAAQAMMPQETPVQSVAPQGTAAQGMPPQTAMQAGPQPLPAAATPQAPVAAPAAQP